jgi:nitrite reductase (NADH) small subunit
MLVPVPTGAAVAVSAGGRRVAVFRVDGEAFAVDDACLHKGGSLSCGLVRGYVVTCPLHWWRYDVRTGERLGPPQLRLRRYQVVVRDGVTCVEIPPADPPRPWREVLLEHARAGRRGPGRGAA